MSAATRRAVREPERADEGFTLVELLLTIAIMGIAFVAILGGMAAVFAGGDIHRKSAQAESELRTFAEEVKSDPYVECASVADYAGIAGGLVLPDGYTAQVVSVSLWDGDPSAPQFLDAGSAGFCPGDDNGIQQIELEVSTTGTTRPVTESVTVLKRRPGPTP